MSKAEKFIDLITKTYSNVVSVKTPHGKEEMTEPWITPDEARNAVEIAREETYDKIWHWLAEHINDYVVEGKGRDIDLMFDDIKQAMNHD